MVIYSCSESLALLSLTVKLQAHPSERKRFFLWSFLDMSKSIKNIWNMHFLCIIRHMRRCWQQNVNNWSFCSAVLEFWSFYGSYCQKKIFNPGSLLWIHFWFSERSSLHSCFGPPSGTEMLPSSEPGGVSEQWSEWMLAVRSTVHRY